MNLYNLINIFEQEYNEENSLAMAKYMRNKFQFLGIKSPKRKELWIEYFKIAKKTKKVDWQFVNYCYDSKYREIHYIAVYYLKEMKKFLSENDIEKIQYIITKNSWWDTIDILDRVVGDIALRFPSVNNILLKWSKDDNIWLRRIAIDHQLLRKDKTNEELLEKILINNFGTNEFFINKAIGWALRDYSKTNPLWVKSFIEKYKNKMSNLSIKEASKYI